MNANLSQSERSRRRYLHSLIEDDKRAAFLRGLTPATEAELSPAELMVVHGYHRKSGGTEARHVIFENREREVIDRLRKKLASIP